MMRHNEVCKIEVYRISASIKSVKAGEKGGAAHKAATPDVINKTQQEAALPFPRQMIEHFYARKAKLMSAEKVDVKAAVQDAEDTNAADVVFINNIKNLNTGKTTLAKMSKADMIKQMPDAYSKMSGSAMEIKINDIKPADEGKAVDVYYATGFKTKISQQDEYGRTITMDMALRSHCLDRLKGVFAESKLAKRLKLVTTQSSCNAEVSYSAPQIKTDIE